MKDGMKKYRNMMKNMERGGMVPDVPEVMRPEPSMMRPGGMMGGTPDMLRRKDALEGSLFAGMTESDMLDSEKESMIKMLEKIAPDKRSISDIREAIDALMSMGFDREGVLEILESTPGLIGNISDKEQVMPRAMTEGALGSLPDTPRPMDTPERFDADRTQSMDMQKTGMGT